MRTVFIIFALISCIWGLQEESNDPDEPTVSTLTAQHSANRNKYCAGSRAKAGGFGCDCTDKIDCNHVLARDCYTQSTSEDCCATCSQYLTGIKDCQYGDQASWCAGQVEVSRNICYRTNTCCYSCQQYKTIGMEGCEYGDQASWCDRIEARDCYIAQTTRTCCETCGKLRLPTPDCEYGDQSVSCSKEDCNEPSRWQSCCKTCEPELRSIISKPRTGGPECLDRAEYCSTMHPMDCYLAMYAHTCCDTCAHKFLDFGAKGCEYGDRARWCQPTHCKDSPNICCDTCR